MDYAFVDVPASVSNGSEITFSNASEVEMHELVLVRLPADETRGLDELMQLLPEEQMELMMGGLVGVSIAPPGAGGMVVEGALTVSEPGRHIMVCIIPTGADPEEYMTAAQESDGPPDVAGGPPHTVEGMYAEFEVE